MAKKLIDRFKREIKLAFQDIKAKVSEETKIQIPIPRNMVGKLTAPVRSDPSFSSFD